MNKYEIKILVIKCLTVAYFGTVIGLLIAVYYRGA